MAENGSGQGKFPRAYVNDVKRDDSMMVYTKFENTEIGARKSGMPDSVSTGPKALDHVGGNANSGKK